MAYLLAGAAGALGSGFHTVNALGQNGVTGGDGGPIYIVDTMADFQLRLAGNGPKIVAVRGSIEYPSSSFGAGLSVGSNTTLIGLGDDAELVYGGLRIINKSNVIIRNLTSRDSFVEGDWDGSTQDFDGVQVDDSHHVWIDPMHITRMGDGLIDLRKDNLDYITVSDSILSNHNKAFGVGWSEEPGQHVTVHTNWVHDTHQRNPAFDNVIGHFYNNLLEDITGYGLNPRGGALVESENIVFDNVERAYLADAATEPVVRGDVLINSPRGSAPTGNAFDPSDHYDFQLLSTIELRAWIHPTPGLRPRSACSH